jgi:energy-coupling factor transporter ATP-binding protein EcfA2
MSTNKTWPGGTVDATPTSYSIPDAADLNWQNLSSFLQALGDSAQGTTFQKWAVRKATSSPITVSATTDCVVVSDLTVAGAVTVNLPAGATKQVFVIVDGKGDAATNNITINRNGTDTIKGATSLVLSHNRDAVVLVYNGTDTDWKVLGPVTIPGSLTAADISGQIPATQIGGGAVDNTEFSYLDGVTSALQTQLNGKQPLDSDLTAIAALASTGLIARTGSGTVATRTITAGSNKLSVTDGDGVAANPTVDVTEANLTLNNIGGTLGVTKGGTGITSGTSGGVPYYSAGTTIASSGALTASGVVLGGGAGASPTSTAAGSANQVLRVPGGGGAPAFGAVDLAQSAAVTGTLPIGNGGTGQTTANNALNALLPSQSGNNGKVLQTDGSNTSWQTAATVPAEGYVYSNGSSLATVGDFSGDANKVAGINSGATAPEYKSLLAGTSGTDFAVAHAAGSITYNLPDASASARGVLTTGTQTLAGAKTWSGAQTFSGNPCFSAYLSADQTITTSTETKIQFNTEEFDQTNAYDNSTNYRFTPAVAGKYIITMDVILSPGTGTTQAIVYLYKNGSRFCRLFGTTSSPAGQTLSPSGAVIVDSNTTDFFEIYVVYAGASGNGSVAGGTGNLSSRFTGAKIA